MAQLKTRGVTMKPEDIIESAKLSAEAVVEDLNMLDNRILGADGKIRLLKDLKQDIKRLDALVTLIDTDC